MWFWPTFTGWVVEPKWQCAPLALYRQQYRAHNYKGWFLVHKPVKSNRMSTKALHSLSLVFCIPGVRDVDSATSTYPFWLACCHESPALVRSCLQFRFSPVVLESQHTPVIKRAVCLRIKIHYVGSKFSKWSPLERLGEEIYKPGTCWAVFNANLLRPNAIGHKKATKVNVTYLFATASPTVVF